MPDPGLLCTLAYKYCSYECMLWWHKTENLKHLLFSAMHFMFSTCTFHVRLKAPLRPVYKCDVGPLILLSDAIAVEYFLSLQIAIRSSSDKYLLFSRLCKHCFILITFLSIWCTLGMGKIEILASAIPFTNHSVLVLFSLFCLCIVLFQFDFLCSMWKWVRLLEGNSSKWSLTTFI